MIIPLTFITINSADHVRDVLFSAVSATRKRGSSREGSIAPSTPCRTALSCSAPTAAWRWPMPKRPSDVAQVARRAARAVDPWLLMRGVAGGMLAPKDCRYIEAQLTRALREGRDRKVLVSLANGQHYEFSAREGSQELGVITFEDVTARVEAEEKIRFMARYDNLTGLPNRAYFHELVGEAMAPATAIVSAAWPCSIWTISRASTTRLAILSAMG